MEVELWSDATEVAIKLKDVGRLQQVHGKCGDPSLQQRIETFVQQ